MLTKTWYGHDSLAELYNSFVGICSVWGDLTTNWNFKKYCRHGLKNYEKLDVCLKNKLKLFLEYVLSCSVTPIKSFQNEKMYTSAAMNL